MYGYFANKSKHRLIVKNIYKNMAIYLKNRKKKIHKKILFMKKRNYFFEKVVHILYINAKKKEAKNK